MRRKSVYDRMTKSEKEVACALKNLYQLEDIYP